MKTYDEVYELLVKSMLERFRVLREQLTPDVKFKDDLELDSLDMTDLLCEIEDQYGKELIDSTIETEENKQLQKEWYEACNGTMDDMCKFLLKTINNIENKNEKDTTLS